MQGMFACLQHVRIFHRLYLPATPISSLKSDHTFNQSPSTPKPCQISHQPVSLSENCNQAQTTYQLVEPCMHAWIASARLSQPTLSIPNYDSTRGQVKPQKSKTHHHQHPQTNHLRYISHNYLLNQYLHPAFILSVIPLIKPAPINGFRWLAR